MEDFEEGEFEYEEGESDVEYSGDDQSDEEAPQLIPAGDPNDLIESESDDDIK